MHLFFKIQRQYSRERIFFQTFFFRLKVVSYFHNKLLHRYLKGSYICLCHEQTNILILRQRGNQVIQQNEIFTMLIFNQNLERALRRLIATIKLDDKKAGLLHVKMSCCFFTILNSGQIREKLNDGLCMIVLVKMFLQNRIFFSETAPLKKILQQVNLQSSTSPLQSDLIHTFCCKLYVILISSTLTDLNNLCQNTVIKNITIVLTYLPLALGTTSLIPLEFLQAWARQVQQALKFLHRSHY